MIDHILVVLSYNLLKTFQHVFIRMFSPINMCMYLFVVVFPVIEFLPRGVSVEQWHQPLQPYAYRYFFNISNHCPHEGTLVTAKLKLDVPVIMTNVTEQSLPGKIRMEVYQITHFFDHKSRNLILLDSKAVNFGRKQTIDFDLYDAVEFWCENPESNFGVEIVIDANQFTSTVSTVHSGPFENDGDMVGLLILETSPRFRRRRRRRSAVTNHQVCNVQSELCCQFPITVTFDDIGLNWIVYPKTYTTYQCAGSCPSDDRLLSLARNDLAVIRSSLHRLNSSLHPAPCCVPTKLSHLDILYTTEDDPPTLEMQELRDFVVEECQCA